MKLISLLGAITAIGRMACCLGQEYTSSQVFLNRDFDGDGAYDWRADIIVFKDTGPLGSDIYQVRNQLRVSQSARVLRASNTRIEFQVGDPISTNRPTYIVEEFGERDLWLLEYYWGIEMEPLVTQGEFRSSAAVILGTKYTDPDTQDVTLGWFKFSRPSVTPGTAFTLESWAYNPIPNEPIRAGFPPDLPAPQFAFSGENSENLDVSWPAKASMLRLETTDSLTPPVQWKPVDTGGATAITLPAGEAQGAFFRLVAPEL